MIDIAAIIKIVGIDIMLGVDNAIVIALACKTLADNLRQKAVLIGTGGAVGLRALLLFFASFLVSIPYVKIVAGLYLVYIGYKLLVEADEEEDIEGANNIWGAVRTIIIADFMMSLDNVLGVTAAAQSAGEHSLLYAILGILLSIPIIVFGASSIMKAMDRFPILLWIGAGLLGWVGVEMLITDPFIKPYVANIEHQLGSIGQYTHQILQSIGFATVVASAYLKEKFIDHKEPTPLT